MKYKDLLNLYKNGQLTEEQRAEVEADIEKQASISEFLFDNDDIPMLTDSELNLENNDSNNDFDEKNFQKMIKKSIRKAFMKLGLAVGIVILIIVLLVNTALPYLVDAMYYNPAAVMGKGNGWETNRLSLDTTVYTELFTPGYYRIGADVFREGYGKYDICIPQNFSVNGQFKDVYGTIEKGKLRLFSDELFKLPTSNAFVSGSIKNVIGHDGAGAAGKYEDAIKKLNELSDSDYYVGYITFDKVMTYDELVRWSKASGITPDWCAVCEKQDKDTYNASNIIGFNYLSGSGEKKYDNEKYPYLNYYDMLGTVESFPENSFSAEVMETHMKSMLEYMVDNNDFCRMVGSHISEDQLLQLKASIEEYGLNIYGFVITAQKDTLIEISHNENVSYIYTSPLR